MYYSIDILTPSGSTQEIDVDENVFCELLKSISERGLKSVAITDDDGTYFYYFWNLEHDFVYFGNSSELLKDYVDSYL